MAVNTTHPMGNNPLAATDPTGLGTYCYSDAQGNFICLTDAPDTGGGGAATSGESVPLPYGPCLVPGPNHGYIPVPSPECTGHGGAPLQLTGVLGSTSAPAAPPKSGILTTIKQKFCSAIPDARTMTIDVGAGGLGSVDGAVTATLDYKTGLTSFSALAGFLGGWNGALSASFSSGYVYGSSNTNVSANYSVGSAVSGYYSKSGGSREVGLSVGWGLLGKYSVGAGKYQSTSSVGNVPGLDLPSDQLLELAKQVCQ